jgi:hypothetical protein
MLQIGPFAAGFVPPAGCKCSGFPIYFSELVAHCLYGNLQVVYAMDS